MARCAAPGPARAAPNGALPLHSDVRTVQQYYEMQSRLLEIEKASCTATISNANYYMIEKHIT
eukprot:2279555-Pleurochrysis_carterae.AAC.3